MGRRKEGASSRGDRPSSLRSLGSSIGTIGERWLAHGSGVRYRHERWRSLRAESRDPLIVRRILERHGVEPSRGGVLDAPCGTGRLRPVLERFPARYVGLDVSPAMLAQAAEAGAPRLVQGSIHCLPFPADTFDVVVACRILHHVREEEELEAYAAELVRVASRLVVASFWDSASLPALRRRVGLRRDDGAGGRRAISKHVLADVFSDAGAEVVAYYHSFRFVSQQAFLVAHKKARARKPKVALAREVLASPAALGAEGALGRA